MSTDLARNLRRLRLAAGLSQAALSAAAGKNPDYIGCIERGAAASRASVLRLAEILSVDETELTRHANDDEAPAGRLPPGRKRKIPGQSGEGAY